MRLTLTSAADEVLEAHADLTMDPDDARFLPHVLATESERLRAHDLLVRSRTTALPRATPARRPLIAQRPSTPAPLVTE